MKYENSVAIIRTKKENTVSVHMISTYEYKKLIPNQFVNEECMCKLFEIFETVGGKVKIKTLDKLKHSDVIIENEITISNVTNIEILTEHNI